MGLVAKITRDLLLRGKWNLPIAGIELMSHTLAGRSYPLYYLRVLPYYTIKVVLMGIDMKIETKMSNESKHRGKKL